MASAPDPTNLGFLLAKAAAQRWNERLARAFAQRGHREVRPSYGSVLLPLWESDGLRIGRLADRARLSKQTLTTLVSAVRARRPRHDAAAIPPTPARPS